MAAKTGMTLMKHDFNVLSAPLNVCLAITNKCNLRCKHCLGSNSRHEPDLTTSELLGVIQQLKELKVLNIAIFGGEPLAREDFFDILDALSKIRVNLTINTNGTLITRDIAHRLSGFPIKSYMVSLDGSSSEVNDLLRGRGSFDAAMEGMRNLMAENCRVSTSTTVMRSNQGDLMNIARLAKSLGVYQARFNNIECVGNAACFRDSLIMKPAEKFESLNEARSLKSAFGGFLTGSLFQVVDLMDEIAVHPKETFPMQISSCGAATTKCAIRPDGWVTPCEIVWDTKAGNLREQSLYDIWHHSPVMQAFREPIEIKEGDIPECKGCAYLKLCYKGHRCQPYYYPGAKFEHKELYCWRSDVVGRK
jgi:SynChlorMet cassette radical SAM/SPASM protein ScmE